MAGRTFTTPWTTGRVGGMLGVSGGGGGGGGGGGTLTGAPPTGGSPAAGHIPGVTNPAGTIAGNLGNIGGIISGITAQQLEALRRQYPTEYFATLQQLLGNTQRRAGGDISDLLPELQTRNAEAGIAGGYSGSQMENTKLLRDLGLTRYGVEEQALKDLGLVQAETPTVKPYDPAAIVAAITNAQAQADINRAAPDPEAAYRRALAAARGAGGGGGAPGPAVRPGYVGGGSGGGGGTVDAILKRYGGSLGGGSGVFAARGTRVGELPSADYENPITFGEGGTYRGGGAGQFENIDGLGDLAGEFGPISRLGEDFGGYESDGTGENYDWLYNAFPSGGENAGDEEGFF